ncbi:MAG TPA: hypothetical protein VLI04_17635 [Nocardioidaceae bacterium]|nr:hypothetical protein [Nocardioidaceae bacterium]
MSTGNADEPTPAQRLILIGCAFVGVAVLVVVIVFVIAFVITGF